MVGESAPANRVGQIVSDGGMREKYWNERERDERLEALREITIHLFGMVQSLQDDVQRLLRHQHSASGQMMMPFDGHEPIYQRRRSIPTPLDNGPSQEAAQHGIGAIHAR